MLTDFEREWLERRRKICLRCEFGPSEKHPKGLCWRGQYCGWDKLECSMFTAPRTGLTLPDMKEAAEFEAECAKRAERGMFHDWHDRFEQPPCRVCIGFGLDKPNPEKTGCLRDGPECTQMWCRILTEMEMEA